MNRYNARSGRSCKVHEKVQKTEVKSGQSVVKPQCSVKNTKQELGDIWVLAVFFLLYLESRDTDFLIILAVLAFSMFDLGDILKL